MGPGGKLHHPCSSPSTSRISWWIRWRALNIWGQRGTPAKAQQCLHLLRKLRTFNGVHINHWTMDPLHPLHKSFMFPPSGRRCKVPLAHKNITIWTRQCSLLLSLDVCFCVFCLISALNECECACWALSEKNFCHRVGQTATSVYLPVYINQSNYLMLKFDATFQLWGGLSKGVRRETVVPNGKKCWTGCSHLCTCVKRCRRQHSFRRVAPVWPGPNRPCQNASLCS